MKLKRKAILLIMSTFLILIAALFVASGLILVSSFVKIEERDMRKDVQRVVDRIDDDVLDLSSRNRDYGSWDQTYNFMEDRNEQYIDSELGDETFSTLKINLLYIADENMNSVFIKKFNTSTSYEDPLSQEESNTLKEIYNNKIVNAQEKQGNFHGIIIFGNSPMLISSREILPSDELGSSRGYLLMGRLLDKDAVDYINKVTHVDFSLLPFKDINSDKEQKMLDNINASNADALVKRVNQNTVEAYKVLNDIYGTPAAVMKVSSYRVIFNQGLAAVRYLLLSLTVIGIVFSYVSMVFMDKVLLNRLLRLNRRVKEIGESEDFSLRVEISGKDELSDLTVSVNNMLARLESGISSLRENNEKLKELDKLKDEFITTVSHELRTPLTSIIGFSKLNKSKFVKVIVPEIDLEDEKIKKACMQLRGNSDIIISEAERLGEIVNDILDISKIEAGKMEYKNELVKIENIINKSASAVDALLMEKHLIFEREIEEDLPFVNGDEDRLMQVIVNLLSNAIKFTEKGSITCRACLTGKEIVVSIIDTGIGIAAEDSEIIFERFRQVGDSLVGKPKGTGLGLPICKSIIEQHGGRIWVERGLGKGSIFSFSLPALKKAI